MRFTSYTIDIVTENNDTLVRDSVITIIETVSTLDTLQLFMFEEYHPVQYLVDSKREQEGKMLAFFATHGSLRGGQLAVTAVYHALSLALKRTVLGTFGSRGQVKTGLLEALSKKPEHKAWVMEARSAAGHPDDADLQDAKEFAGLMITKARSM